MASGKHSSIEDYEEKEFPWKIIGIVLAVISIIAIVGFSYKNIAGKISESLENKENQNSSYVAPTTKKAEYKKIGTIEIESKSYKKDIFDADKNSNFDKALEKGLVKLYGENINTVGNFCIMGHNDSNNFAVLNELNVGDTFVLTNLYNENIKYEVKEIYTVDPTDMKCLMPNKEEKEVTLITCTDGSNQRVVVKAFEVSSDNVETENNELENVDETILEN